MVELYNSHNASNAEVNANLAGGIGNLSLTNAQVQDIVAFLQTLSDGHVVP